MWQVVGPGGVRHVRADDDSRAQREGAAAQRAEVSVEQFGSHAADCAHADGLPSRAAVAARLAGAAVKIW